MPATMTRGTAAVRMGVRRLAARSSARRGQDAVDDLDDRSDAQLIHSALRGDLELVTGYGEEHPGTWAGVWFENEPTVYIVAAFTSDVAQHDTTLRPRLRPPGRLRVQRMPHSLADLRHIRQEIERTLQQRAAVTGRPILTSIGNGKAVIRVS